MLYRAANRMTNFQLTARTKRDVSHVCARHDTRIFLFCLLPISICIYARAECICDLTFISANTRFCRVRQPALKEKKLHDVVRVI